jgi:hypothetical protein
VNGTATAGAKTLDDDLAILFKLGGFGHPEIGFFAGVAPRIFGDDLLLRNVSL